MPIHSRKILLTVLLTLSSLPMLAQQDISMKLKINNKEKLTIYRDEPLLVTLDLSNPKASADEQWNREAEAGLSELEAQHLNKNISDKKFANEKQHIESAKKKIQPVLLGSDETPVA